jgi:peptidoglycan/LPS O-acetylase OafA/YrhL
MVWLAAAAIALVAVSPNTSDVWLVFFLGMACAVLLDDPRTRAPLCQPMVAAGALAGVAVFCYLLRDFFIPSVCFGGALFPLFLVVAAGNSVFGFLTHPATRCLGAISYSLYLLHGIVFYFAVSALRLFGPAQLTQPMYWTLIIAAAVATALLCAATYRWIEFPYMRARRPG